jgi:hypothetical protein
MYCSASTQYHNKVTALRRASHYYSLSVLSFLHVRELCSASPQLLHCLCAFCSQLFGPYLRAMPPYVVPHHLFIKEILSHWSVFEIPLGDEYLAGFWRQNLPYYMLWSRRKDGSLYTEPITYIAPTWSWASVQAPVTLHPVTNGSNEEILIDVLEAETYTSSKDSTGSVFGGYIKLRGFLRDAEFAVWPTGHFEGYRNSGSIMDRMRLSMEPQGSPANIIVWADETDKIAPEKPEQGRNRVSCLPIQV